MLESITLGEFEGPLDLLLQLIEAEKLPINSVALSQVTEHYSAIVTGQNRIPLEELADYLVILSKLLLLKSQTLIPSLAAEEEQGPTLVDQLKMYQRYREKMEIIERLWVSDAVSFPRPKPPAQWVAQFRPPRVVDTRTLASVFQSVIASIVPPKTVFRQLVDRAITLQQKIQEIAQRITVELKTSFSSIVNSRKNKTEMIVSFLALLELVKQRTITVSQNTAFEDMEIQRYSS